MSLAAPIADAVDRLHALDGVDVAFSARLDRRAHRFVLGDMRGTRATSLHGLVSPLGFGVGGRCAVLRRPVSVSDYVRDAAITHQFDGAVSEEGLRAVLAVPFHVDGEVHGMVYGASRRPIRFAERFVDVAVSIVRTAERASAAPPPTIDEPAGHRTPVELRELHAELRAIAATVADRATQDRLHRICLRLGGDRPAAHPATRLSPREIDVLAQVAVGCSNAETARRLSLRVETVKSYLKTAMVKLDSHNRCEAVFLAQRAGLLP